MGTQFEASCNQCDTKFVVREGGGFDFFLLHCDQCGHEKEVKEAEVRVYMAAKKEPLPIKQEVEQYVPPCSIDGGVYRLKARARCPKCHSNDYSMVDGSRVLHYE